MPYAEQFDRETCTNLLRSSALLYNNKFQDGPHGFTRHFEIQTTLQPPAQTPGFIITAPQRGILAQDISSSSSSSSPRLIRDDMMKLKS